MGFFKSSYDNVLRWMPQQDFTDDKSTSVQVMAWCRQATSHHLNQCRPVLMPCGITRPQWVKYSTCFLKIYLLVNGIVLLSPRWYDIFLSWLTRSSVIGLVPIVYQAVTRTNPDLLSIGPSGTTFSEIWSKMWTFSLKRLLLNMSTRYWAFCLSMLISHQITRSLRSNLGKSRHHLGPQLISFFTSYQRLQWKEQRSFHLKSKVRKLNLKTFVVRFPVNKMMSMDKNIGISVERRHNIIYVGSCSALIFSG